MDNNAFQSKVNIAVGNSYKRQAQELARKGNIRMAKFYANYARQKIAKGMALKSAPSISKQMKIAQGVLARKGKKRSATRAKSKSGSKSY